MSDIIMIEKTKDIDLCCHGVIEAHAGTGKTYAIVQMVLRILEQTVTDTGKDQKRFIHIREILLVTFTEKAAGELRKRIRKGLEKSLYELRKDAASTGTGLIRHLEDCQNNLHEALIGTIHGICLRLLQTWPFETGVHFTTEMVDDSEGLADALRESIRTDWQESATNIPWALAQLQEQGMQLHDDLFGLVRTTAEKLLDQENTVLDRRTLSGNCLHDLPLKIKAIREYLEDRKKAAVFKSAIQALIDALENAGNSGSMEPDRLEKLQSRVPELQEMCRAEVYDTKILQAPCKVGRGGIYTKAQIKKDPVLAELDACCEAVASHAYCVQLVERENFFAVLPMVLACDAAELLRDRWTKAKQEKGLISFQDMLRLMHKAVFDNPSFCAALRRRLRYGIIDEFQDTSILQWRIFKRVFLETSGGNEPRLFIVGDPKQSIYAFQGADVQGYLDAKSAIVKAQGKAYGLIENYRSLEKTIDGYNSIIKKEDSGPDWFAFDDSSARDNKISYPSGDKGGAIACIPKKRLEKPEYPLPACPVQVMVLGGKAGERRATMAEWTSRAIRSLKGKTISVPDGLTWKNITLDYKDFAVIVEAHGLAEPFLERFQSDGIPAVKYKMEGVFQSPMARDLHALLRAILHPAGKPAPRLAALLTRFFNLHPAAIDPEKDLEPCRNPYEDCRQGNSCIFHALEEWTGLASKQRWSQLFNRIQVRSGIRERLIRFADGQRHLADLRQVSDYCMEKLYRGNYSLEQLVEHLGLLLAGEETMGQDENLYMLSTDKSSVRVLTMHAAKGLEFPIVFAATGGSGRKGKGMGTLCWIDDEYRKHILPMESITDTGDDFTCLFEKEMKTIRSWNVKKEGTGQNTKYALEIEDKMLPLPDVQRIQERRRLLYVALTRAQAMVFVPVHLRDPGPENNPVAWAGRALPSYSPDTDLTPRLLHLLKEKKTEEFDGSLPVWQTSPPVKIKEPENPADSAAGTPDSIRSASDKIEKQIAELALSGLICRQTSYTELSREADSDRTIDHSEEEHKTPEGKNRQELPLPSSAQTGDALHQAIEELLGIADSTTLINDTESVASIVRKHLERNGILKSLSNAVKQTDAVAHGVSYVKSALTTPLQLPRGGTVAITDLKPFNRIAEMEFQLGVSPHWVHGYMDLVFRLENKNAASSGAHPWRYFVLDWKSDQLETFDEQSVATRIQERHYDLQAKIYCHALDRYLKGILGNGYDPAQNLGGAVYVFLRSFQDTPPMTICHCWKRQADPVEDSNFTSEQIHNLIGKNTP
jgi:ATP-dependent exoDNAse (exonuclease V) beta subunit